MAQQTARDFTFTVPAGAGSFATQQLHLRPSQDGGTYDKVDQLRAFVKALPATATVEVGYYSGDGSWNVLQALTTTGLGALLELAGLSQVVVRVKSGGTGGTATVTVAWQ